MLSFDDYADIGARLDAVLAGERRPAHQPRDRRRLLPDRPGRAARGAARTFPAMASQPGAGGAIPDLPAGRGAGVRAPGAAAQAGRRAGGPAQDRLGL